MTMSIHHAAGSAAITVLIAAAMATVSVPTFDNSAALAGNVAFVAPSAVVAPLPLQAPVGHRQPRLQDLPLTLQQQEDRLSREEKRLDWIVNDSICSGC
jgi:hypothetical protein